MKVLGVCWDTQEEKLNLYVSEIPKAAKVTEPTKRHVVSIVGRFFDPLGFLAPVIIRFKLLFQKLCRQQLKWNEALPDLLQREWMTLQDLQVGDIMSIPRSYEGIDNSAACYTLCGFCGYSVPCGKNSRNDPF